MFLRRRDYLRKSFSTLFIQIEHYNEKLSFTNSLLGKRVKDLTPKVEGKFNQNLEKFNKKSKDFSLSSKEYQKILQDSKTNIEENTIISFDFKGSQIMFMNLMNDEVYENLDTLLSKIKADKLLLQDFPKDFEIDMNIKNPKTNKFSNRNYFKQLYYSNYTEQCEQNTNFVLRGQENDFGKEEVNEEVKENKLFENILSEESLLAEKNPIFASLPHKVFKHNLVNTFSLPQIFNLFKAAVKETVFNKDEVTCEYPRAIFSQLLPEVIMKWEDQYISTLIEYLVAKESGKNILVLTNNLHFQTILFYLQNRLPSSISKEIELLELKENDFRDIKFEEYSEKLAILDSFTSIHQSSLNPSDLKLSNELLNEFIPAEKLEICSSIYNSLSESYLFKKEKLSKEYRNELESNYLEKILII